MSGPRASIMALAALATLGACAGGESQPPPRRPQVQAPPDTVSRIDQALLLGTWRCRELNPYPGAPVVATTMTFLRDGSMLSEGRSEPKEPLGSVIVTSTGRWQIAGDKITMTDVKTAARSADNNPATNALLQLGTGLANNLMAQQKPGASDVLTLSRSDLVIRPGEVDDPPLIACSRG